MRRALILVTLALAACGSEQPRAFQPPDDPVLADALAEPLLTDPDLAELNQRGAVLALNLPQTLPVPPDHPDPQGARDEAVKLAGGLLPALPPAQGKAAPAPATLAAAAEAALGKSPCLAKATPGFGWAAQMPAAFPVFPRGHAQEALGAGAAGCGLRAVTFTTPVAASEVLAFYHARARSNGFSSVHTDGDAPRLSGRNGAQSYAVFARSGADGLTLVMLVTSG